MVLVTPKLLDAAADMLAADSVPEDDLQDLIELLRRAARGEPVEFTPSWHSTHDDPQPDCAECIGL